MVYFLWAVYSLKNYLSASQTYKIKKYLKTINFIKTPNSQMSHVYPAFCYVNNANVTLCRLIRRKFIQIVQYSRNIFKRSINFVHKFVPKVVLNFTNCIFARTAHPSVCLQVYIRNKSYNKVL